uniref:Uncharacterized protein n=1 Tax=Chenopodium quinoa TaxID=63459 RepID=A0A803M3I8_CHEQI
MWRLPVLGIDALAGVEKKPVLVVNPTWYIISNYEEFLNYDGQQSNPSPRRPCSSKRRCTIVRLSQPERRGYSQQRVVCAKPVPFDGSALLDLIEFYPGSGSRLSPIQSSQKHCCLTLKASTDVCINLCSSFGGVRYYVIPWKSKKLEIRLVVVSQFYDGFRVGYLGDDIDVTHMRIEDTGQTLYAFSQSTTKWVGKRWRGQIVMLGLLFLSLGLLTLTALACLTRNSSWRLLYYCTSIPGIICSILIYFLLCESPRWLFMRGRQMDAVKVLKSIGTLDDQMISSLPNMLEFEQGFGLNIYLSLTFNAVQLLVSLLLTCLFWVPICNRRSSVLGFCTFSGAASVIFITVGHFHKVELFPTCIGNTAASLSRQALLFVSIFVPVLVVIL